MRITEVLTFLLPAITVRTWTEASETSITIHNQQICNQQCYAAYHSLMGDDFEGTGYHSASHPHAAEMVCASKQCSECEICDLGPTSHFPVLSLHNVELNRIANAEARMRVDYEEPTSCINCQWYLDKCEQSNEYDIEYQPPTPENELLYPLHEADHRTTLQCELLLCTAGPTHCGVNCQCERRICKDLAARTGLLQPGHTLECKGCTKPWIECIHDTCFAPTHDAFADRLPGLDCLEKNAEECQQYSWQALNAKVAPDQGCVARCWARTPTHCHTGSCALALAASTMQSFTTPSIASAQHHFETLARGCNSFRNTCLEACDAGKTYSKCMKHCNELHGAFANHRERCGGICEERTCGNECRDMTCCIGPEQCREGGEAYRCTKRSSCGRHGNLMEDSAMSRHI